MSAASQVHDATSHVPPSMFTTKHKVIAGIVVPALVGGLSYAVHKKMERDAGPEKTAGIADSPRLLQALAHGALSVGGAATAGGLGYLSEGDPDKRWQTARRAAGYGAIGANTSIFAPAVTGAIGAIAGEPGHRGENAASAAGWGTVGAIGGPAAAIVGIKGLAAAVRAARSHFKGGEYEPLTEDQIRHSIVEKDAGFKERFADFMANDPSNRKVKTLLYGVGGVAGAGMGAVGGLADNALNPGRTEEERRKAMLINVLMGGAGGAFGSHMAITGAGL